MYLAAIADSQPQPPTMHPQVCISFPECKLVYLMKAVCRMVSERMLNHINSNFIYNFFMFKTALDGFSSFLCTYELDHGDYTAGNCFSNHFDKLLFSYLLTCESVSVQF